MVLLPILLIGILLIGILLYIVLTFSIDYILYRTKIKKKTLICNYDYVILCDIINISGVYLWRMRYYDKIENLSIGCETKSIKEWDYFFSFKSRERFSTRRYTTRWFLLKYRYKLMKKYLISNNIING